MRKKRTLQELTIKDNFMFGAVMIEEENCRLFLERVLGFRIAKVEVKKEHSLVYHPEYKGVRLDIYANDENNTHYNVEMQAVQKPALGKRSRYYHSQIDMELLLSGRPYEELPNTYVIFICDFDPFGEKKYRYTFEKICRESEDVKIADGSTTIFLSTKGENCDQVSPELVKFLKFVQADLAESVEDFEDEFVKRLQISIQHIKGNREMEGRYMLFEEMIREERLEAIAETVLEFLQEHGDVPKELQEEIMSQMNKTTLKKWIKLAAKAESIEQFQQQMNA